MADKQITWELIAKDKATAALRAVEGSAQKLGGHLKGLASSAKVGLAGLAGGAVVKLGVDLLATGEAAGNLERKAKTVFGSSFPAAEAAAESLSGRLGMSKASVEGLLAGFGDLLTPMGFATDKAADMAGRMGTLTSALSLWSGGTKSASDMAEVLQGALTGEFDSLKSVGVQISSATVQEQLHAAGKDKLTGKALQQAQAEIVLNEIYNQSGNAITAYNNHTNKLTEAKLKLKSQVENVKVSLANGLMPVATALGSWMAGTGVPAMMAFAHTLSANKDVLIPLVAVVGTGIGVWKGIQLATRTWAAAQLVLNAVLTANPIGIVIALAAALAVGVYVLWQRSETFRDGVTTTFNALQTGAETAFNFVRNAIANIAVPAFKFLLNAYMSVVGGILDGAVAMFGWVPGIGDKLKGARDKFYSFRDQANKALDGIQDNLRVTVNATVRVHIPGSGSVGYSKTGAQAPRYNGPRAGGGPVAGGGTYLVGESGPEILRLNGTTGGSVVPSGLAARSLRGGGGGDVHVHIHGSLIASRRELVDLVAQGITEARARGWRPPAGAFAS